MEDCLRDFRDDFCEPYLDDVIVYSKSFKELVEHVRQVLRRLRENGIKLRANMCNLFQKRCVNAKAIEEFRTHEPQNAEDVRKLPGLFGYYHRYVENFQGSPNPFSTSYKSVLSVLNRTCLTQVKKNESNKKIQVSFKTPVMWEEKHRQALNVLASHPVLATNRRFTAFYFTY